MHRANPTVVFLAATVLMLVALFVPGRLGGVLLLLVAAAAAALLVGAWDRLPPIGRLGRIAVLALVLVLAISRLV